MTAMFEWSSAHPGSYEQLQLRYRNFAEIEAQGVSSLYVELAECVASSEALLTFIAALPQARQQPNLVFAAVRHLYGTPRDSQHFTALVAQHPDAIRDIILSHTTQTNEPGRCAVLLPVLALLPQPLALLEVGASAGLCLLPDYWAYDYGHICIPAQQRSAEPAPVFPCQVNAATPLPERMPEIIWRAGLDLNPLTLSDPEHMAWLKTLVWPGQEQRAERLDAAIRVAQGHAPAVIAGDLVADLAALAQTAPDHATLVVFHSAVLAYVTHEQRQRFMDSVAELGAVWISHEAPQVLPMFAAKLRHSIPSRHFLLAVNGEPVAATNPHGLALEWFEGALPLQKKGFRASPE